ncbi:MAG: isopenicillin N synthase family oxygenase [Leptolyngbya sp. SIO1E4]|nr:isopenicillin N synthase family oxygenase [Leptolyngbya sp. SIO1E4]
MIIPLIDFAPFLTDDPEGQQHVAQALFRACHEVGFLYLKNHGIPLAAVDRTFEQSHAFFARSLAEKQQVAWVNEESNRGYVGIERERLDETQPGDLKEAFNVGKEVPAEVAAGDAAIAANRWPPNDAVFRQTVSEFFDQCAMAAERLFRAFAIALSMPADYLVERHQTREYTLRLLHYPPLAALPKPGQLRAGAHSDYGTLTLLFQDSVGGLEVLNTQGQWVAAPAIPGTIVVNTGDLTQRWSNDVFRSTQHRVGLPQGQQARYSIAFFCEPDADTNIVCLPTCQSEATPPKYPPVNARDYLLSRLQATY